MFYLKDIYKVYILMDSTGTNKFSKLYYRNSLKLAI